MNLVKLTRLDGEPVWINPDQVCAVTAPVADDALKGAHAHIRLTNGSEYVTESPALAVEQLRIYHDQTL